jgi:hypothetical protein
LLRRGRAGFLPSVLIVEAGSELRSMAGFLVESGFELAYEATGPDALDRLASYQPDVIVLNLAATTDASTLIEQLRIASPAAAILQIAPASGGMPVPHGAADDVVSLPLVDAAVAESIWRLAERDAGASWTPTQ